MIVEFNSLVKSYGDHFKLSVESLRISSGEALGLVGNNGAGKTTFLRLLLDLVQPDGGSIEVNGEVIKDNTTWKSNVGSYLDESFLLDFLRPDEFFRFVGGVYNLSDDELESTLSQYEAFLPTQATNNSQPFIRDLSMGNKKKIGIVSALMVHPRLIILDEPFANLDPGSQIRLKKMLRSLREEFGTTMLISSHDLLHVTDVCERVVLLEDGVIIRDIQTSDATLQELELYFADSE